MDTPCPQGPNFRPTRTTKINYEAKTKFSPDNDTSPNLNLAGIRRFQGIAGDLLYYARALNNKIPVSLNSIGTQQDAATDYTAAAVHQLLGYLATYPNDGIT